MKTDDTDLIEVLRPLAEADAPPPAQVQRVVDKLVAEFPPNQRPVWVRPMVLGLGLAAAAALVWWSAGWQAPDAQPELPSHTDGIEAPEDPSSDLEPGAAEAAPEEGGAEEATAAPAAPAGASPDGLKGLPAEGRVVEDAEGDEAAPADAPDPEPDYGDDGMVVADNTFDDPRTGPDGIKGVGGTGPREGGDPEAGPAKVRLKALSEGQSGLLQAGDAVPLGARIRFTLEADQLTQVTLCATEGATTVPFWTDSLKPGVETFPDQLYVAEAQGPLTFTVASGRSSCAAPLYDLKLEVGE